MLRPTALTLLALTAPNIAIYARAEVFMSETQAVKMIFPAGTFTKKTVTLSSEDVEKIEKAQKDSVHSKELTVYKSELGDTVFIDQALGKHEWITYAVGINKDGSVKGIEILEYKETYGGQVRGEAWRNQFVGKRVDAPLKLGDDIKNLSGATLSSAHITAGVKRILVTYDDVKARL